MINKPNIRKEVEGLLPKKQEQEHATGKKYTSLMDDGYNYCLSDSVDKITERVVGVEEIAEEIHSTGSVSYVHKFIANFLHNKYIIIKRGGE